MTAKARTSNAFWWALIGFLVGVAATLGGLIYIGRDARGPDRSAAASAAAPLISTVHKHAKLSASAPAEDLSISDGQVAEDAAAAGMTSRTRTTP